MGSGDPLLVEVMTIVAHQQSNKPLFGPSRHRCFLGLSHENFFVATTNPKVELGSTVLFSQSDTFLSSYCSSYTSLTQSFIGGVPLSEFTQRTDDGRRRLTVTVTVTVTVAVRLLSETIQRTNEPSIDQSIERTRRSNE